MDSQDTEVMKKELTECGKKVNGDGKKHRYLSLALPLWFIAVFILLIFLSVHRYKADKIIMEQRVKKIGEEIRQDFQRSFDANDSK